MTDYGHADLYQKLLGGVFPEEDIAKWTEFNDLIAEAVEHVWGEDQNQHPSLLLGASWGAMGEPDSGLPECLVTTNLHPCGMETAVEMMLSVAAQAHDRHHQNLLQLQLGENHVVERINDAALTDEQKQEAEALKRRVAEEMGVSLDDVRVQYYDAADTSDLEVMRPDHFGVPPEKPDTEEENEDD